jgi:hypothetical protein
MTALLTVVLTVSAIAGVLAWLAASPVRLVTAFLPVALAHPTPTIAVVAAVVIGVVIAAVIAALVLWRELASSRWLLISVTGPARTCGGEAVS